MAMDIRSIETLINTRGLIKISSRNGWAAGTVGIALGYNAQYDTVRVGFVDAEGQYIGEKTTVARSMVEPAPAEREPMDATAVEIAIRTNRKLRVLETASTLYGRTVFVTAVDAETNMVRVLPVNERGFATLEAGVVMLWDLEAFPEDETVVPSAYSPLSRSLELRCTCGTLTSVHPDGTLSNHELPYGVERTADNTAGNTFLCRYSGRTATLRALEDRDSRLTREESRIRHIIAGALEAEGAELPSFPWERRQRTNPAA